VKLELVAGPPEFGLHGLLKLEAVKGAEIEVAVEEPP